MKRFFALAATIFMMSALTAQDDVAGYILFGNERYPAFTKFDGDDMIITSPLFDSIEQRLSRIEVSLPGDIVRLPQCEALTFSVFNEQQLAWGFSLQNTTGNEVEQWEVRIIGADYDVDFSRVQNGDELKVETEKDGDLINYTIRSTRPLGAFSTTSTYQLTDVDFGRTISSRSREIFCQLSDGEDNNNGLSAFLASNTMARAKYHFKLSKPDEIFGLTSRDVGRIYGYKDYKKASEKAIFQYLDTLNIFQNQ